MSSQSMAKDTSSSRSYKLGLLRGRNDPAIFTAHLSLRGGLFVVGPVQVASISPLFFSPSCLCFETL